MSKRKLPYGNMGGENLADPKRADRLLRRFSWERPLEDVTERKVAHVIRQAKERERTQPKPRPVEVQPSNLRVPHTDLSSQSLLITFCPLSERDA